MCGIAAIYSNKANIPKVLSKAVEVLRSRGPDNQNIWSNGNGVGLAHTRLAILDLSATGNQPFANETKEIFLVSNGEIYNHKTLRKQLLSRGHKFLSQSDNEVILHAYEQWGLDCVEHFIGMFSFVIWDNTKKEFFAARDHIGIKPLYYSNSPDGIAFSSTLDSLMILNQMPLKIKPLALAYALTLRYVPSPYAFWENSNKLQPGHTLTYSKEKGLKIKPYWVAPIDTDYSANYSYNNWLELYNTVIKDHLMSDVPLSIFLSAGLDSTSIAIAISELGIKFSAISGSIEEYEANEFHTAKLTAEKLACPCIKVPIHSNAFNSYEKQILDAFDEPQIDSGPLPMYLVSQAASKKFKVSISGDGGDECFGGYPWHRPFGIKESKTNKILKKLLPFSKKYLDNNNLFLQDYANRTGTPFSVNEVNILFSPIISDFSEEKRVFPFKKHYIKKIHPLRAYQRIDLFTFCSDLCLFKVDRASMANSLEVRVPFLDKRILEWSLSRPFTEEDVQLKNAKSLLREYVKTYNLSNVLKQPKSGFSLKGLEMLSVSPNTVNEINKGILVKGGYLVKNWEKMLPYNNANLRKIWVLKYLSDWLENKILQIENYKSVTK
ncbi:MAG: asparagine synthase (glutamine-hydrolyzing) [Verrucomicrobiota bacterium]|nr:asparagine synthase (glutamine-hydrolyzing) [Verrucomicrobiota bacterium]